MSLPLFVQNGWYGALRPDGTGAVQVPFELALTNRGPVPTLPEGERWGIQISDVAADGRFAGIAHDIGGTWEWTGAEWRRLPFVSGRGKYVGSTFVDGWPPAGVGFIDDSGEPVSRLITHEIKHDLNEWTEVGGLLFGQHHDLGGVYCFDGAHHRQIDDGPCMEINVHHDGDLFAVAYRKDKVGFYPKVWRRAELRALPMLQNANTSPQVSTIPDTPPEPKPMSTPNRVDIAQAVAAQYPELVKLNTSGACGRLTEYIAQVLYQADPGWGLLSKSPGEHQYNGHAIDAVIYRPTQQVIDMMSGAGDRDPGSGVPLDQQHDIRIKWDEAPKRAGNEWMAPTGVTPQPPIDLPPQPRPEPPAQSVDFSPLLDVFNKQYEYLKLQIADLHVDLLNLDKTTKQKLDAIADHQVQVKFPPYVGALGYKLRLTPEEPKK